MVLVLVLVLAGPFLRSWLVEVEVLLLWVEEKVLVELFGETEPVELVASVCMLRYPRPKDCLN